MLCDVRWDAKKQLLDQEGRRVSHRARKRRRGRDGSELRMRPERTGVQDPQTRRGEGGRNYITLVKKLPIEPILHTSFYPSNCSGRTEYVTMRWMHWTSA
jgi:hypothetical protein